EALNGETFRAAFAQGYLQHYNMLSPVAPLSPQGARASTDDIVEHRTNDARWLAHLTTQSDFVAEARTALPHPVPYRLPPEKIKEMIAQFIAGSDGITHAIQNMNGHRTGHLALVQTYNENGPLQQLLAQHLTPLLQDAPTA